MATSIPSPEQTPPPTTANVSSSFDIEASYQKHLQGPPALPSGLAAIAALTSALEAHSNLNTLSEAISLLSALNTTLKSKTPTPQPIAAGTDAFLHSLVTTASQSNPPDESESAEKTTQHVLDASKRTIDKALQARRKIASLGKRVIRPGSVVVLAGYDELVEELVLDAADADVRFRVVLVKASSAARSGPGSDAAEGLAEKLQKRETETAIVPPEALAYTLTTLASGAGEGVGQGVVLLTGASALLADGGALAPMGTLQAMMLAKALGVPRYVVCETWKAVAVLPLPGEGASSPLSEDVFAKGSSGSTKGHGNPVGGRRYTEHDMDITPPEYITSVVTEHGPLSTTALSEESIRFWF